MERCKCGASSGCAKSISVVVLDAAQCASAVVAASAFLKRQ
jgi:hypothetical protein